MENKTSLDNEIAAAVQRCAAFGSMVMELLVSTTVDRGSADPSIAAKAQRALANAEFAQTTPARAITSAAKQVVMTLTKRGPALKDGIAAAADIVVAIARLRALQDAEDARQAEMSKDLGNAGIPVEAQRLIRKLVKLGVSPSMFDLLTEQELLVMARLLWEKNDDYKHVGPGIWMAIWRAGFIEFPAAGLTEDEATAVRATSNDAEGMEAKRFIEDVAGRELDISPMLALQLMRNYRAKVKSRGLRLTREEIGRSDADDDVQFILDALGLDEHDREHADVVWQSVYAPKLEKFEHQRAKATAAREKLILFYLPLARQVRARRARKHEAWQAKQPQQTEDGQANPRRSRAPEADRLDYNAAIARGEDQFDREVAAWITDSERYRKRLRRMGFEVPEPPASAEDEHGEAQPVSAGYRPSDRQAAGDVTASDLSTPEGDTTISPESAVAKPLHAVSPTARPASDINGRTRAELNRIMRGEE